eukprot:scaffold12985_cov69-Isochrysis_galbana.AAC.2
MHEEILVKLKTKTIQNEEKDKDMWECGVAFLTPCKRPRDDTTPPSPSFPAAAAMSPSHPPSPPRAAPSPAH